MCLVCFFYITMSKYSVVKLQPIYEVRRFKKSVWQNKFFGTIQVLVRFYFKDPENNGTLENKIGGF